VVDSCRTEGQCPVCGSRECWIVPAHPEDICYVCHMWFKAQARNFMYREAERLFPYRKHTWEQKHETR